MALLGTIALFALLVLPVLGGNKLRSERMVCINNLRQIGMGFQQWAGSYNDEKPWRVAATNGGTSGHTLAANAWFHFVSLSNEIQSPKMLACPSDAEVRVAYSWGSGRDGFLNPANRGNSLSYFVGGHADFVHPLSIASGDRNIVPSSYNSGCELIGVNSATVALTSSSFNYYYPPFGWNTNSLHGTEGNILLNGGEVLEVSRYGLGGAVHDSLWYERDTIHLLLPR